MSTTQPPAGRATRSGEGAARVAQSALLREVPATVAAGRLATRVSAAAETRMGTCSRSSPAKATRAGSSETRAERDCQRCAWPASR
jgi:hypothetical protein